MSKRNLGQRFRILVDQRLEVSNHQKNNFLHNALNDLGEKIKVFAVQGFGRFGLLGPGGSDLPTGKKAKKSEPRDWAPFGPVGSDSRVRYDHPPRLGSDRLGTIGPDRPGPVVAGWVGCNSALASRRPASRLSSGSRSPGSW